MSNVLLLSSGYCGKVTANGSCARALVEELLRQGMGARVVCYNDSQDECEEGVVSVCYHSPEEKAAANALQRYWHIGKKLLKEAIAPPYDRQLAQTLFEKADKVCSTEKIDMVVAVYFAMMYPVELIEVGRMLKAKYPQMHLCIYELDSVADGIASQSKWKWLTLPSYRRYLNKIYRKADSVFLMKSHEEHWKAQHGKYSDKLVLVDIPVLRPCTLPQVTKSSDDVTFLYGGLVDAGYRSPACILNLFAQEEKALNWRVCFYSKGCEEMLRSAAEQDKRIQLMGYVKPEVLEQAIAEADVLLSIGNAYSNSLPSKLINYMGYGKPIVHFSLQKHDICADYLNRYPLALVIPAAAGREEVGQMVTDFVKRCRGKRLTYEEVAAELEMNTPQYTVKQMCSLL